LTCSGLISPSLKQSLQALAIEFQTASRDCGAYPGRIEDSKKSRNEWPDHLILEGYSLSVVDCSKISWL
jgi:hypothetical protein